MSFEIVTILGGLFPRRPHTASGRDSSIKTEQGFPEYGGLPDMDEGATLLEEPELSLGTILPELHLAPGVEGPIVPPSSIPR
ncbi:MAG TPA: hypothetical protein VKQ52_16155 [Puia sp.]|nr:hypothetical protein [Puia sp.]